MNPGQEDFVFWVNTFLNPQIYSDTFSHYTIFTTRIQVTCSVFIHTLIHNLHVRPTQKYITPQRLLQKNMDPGQEDFVFWVDTFLNPQIYSDTFLYRITFYNSDSSNMFRVHSYAHP
jgi:arginine exporter protein ArgO